MTPRPEVKAVHVHEAKSKETNIDKLPGQPVVKHSAVIQPPPVEQPVNFQQPADVDGPEVGDVRGKGDIGLRLDQLRPVKEKLIDVEIWSRAGVGMYN